MHRATKRQLTGLAGLLVVAAAGTLLVSPAGVVAALEGLADEPVVFVLALVALYLVRSLFLWPVTLLSVCLGYLYDPVVAVPIALAGAAGTGLPPFVVARYAPTDEGVFGAVAELGRRTVVRVGAFRGVVAGRLIPIPTDIVSYAAGLSEISVVAFLAGTALGELPWTIAAVAAGNAMRTLTLEGLHFDPALILGLLGAAVLLVGGPVLRRRHAGDLRS